MSDPSEPKGPPNAQPESPTRAFSLKLDGWMAELAQQDFALDADGLPIAAPPAEAAAPVAPAASPPVQPPKR